MMRDMEKEFLAHVAINGRIYEFALSNFGCQNELLKINDIPFPEFSQLTSDELLHKRSINIENHMVHFYFINEKISVDLEEPDMNKSTVVEKLGAPCFSVISDIVDNEGYYTDETTKKEEKKSHFVLFIYILIMMCGFVLNPPLGMYSGMLLCVILDFILDVLRKHKIAKQFSRDKERWL